jgi:flagella basal body P-ring formation protein FlgA
LIASNKIPSGRVITSQDVIKQTVEISDLRGSYYRELDDIVGKVSRRIFSSGDLLTRESFTEPLLVKTGETVRLRLERDGIVLTSLAKAEQDGKLGQMIRVRNIDYSTLLKAQVTGRAEVKLQ